MQWTSFITASVLLVGAALAVAGDKGENLTFDKKDLGKVPAGWTAEKTGKGEGSVWKVVEDASAPSKSGYVLAQTAESPNGLFNVCVVNDTNLTDVEISVAFKAIKGKNDQGGGLVWRYQDANNYYICRMNPLEDNYRVYKVVAGKRTQLETKEKLTVKANEWHKLKVEMEGNHIECYLDGEKMLDVKDNTFQKAGKVGLWTKSDAQTYFDDFKVSGKK
ncbi:MAG: family 16 glycoside hydrolase [Gemmataceae bacterium]